MVYLKIVVILLVFMFTGCTTVKLSKLETVSKVDIERFMGKWFVIGLIPTFIEKNAVNGIEHYELKDNNKIAITYTFNQHSADGKLKTMKPKGRVYDLDTYAEWRVRFFHLFTSPYLIIDLDDDYTYTVIGVPNRKYVWIMSRDYVFDDNLYNKILDTLAERGYDISKIKKMSQEW